MMLNKAVLTKSVYDKFIYRFFYNKNMGEKTRKFIKNSIQYETTHHNVSNPRVSSIPYTKWYIKKYYHKYVLENKKKYHSVMALKKIGLDLKLKTDHSATNINNHK